MKDKRSELSIHPFNTYMCGMDYAEDYINKALDDHMPAIAITDHDSVQSLPNAYRVMNELKDIGYGDIKLIYGIDSHYKKGDHIHRISILAKDRQGLKFLYRLFSDANTKYFDSISLFSLESIMECRNNLLLGVNFMSEILPMMHNGTDDEKLYEFVSFFDYILLEPISHFKVHFNNNVLKSKNELIEYYNRIIMICEKAGTKPVASDDAHYCYVDDAECEKVLKMYKENTDYSKNPKMHFLTTEEMLSEFYFLGEEKAKEIVIKNTNTIADMIADTFPPISQKHEYPHIVNSFTSIKEIAFAKAESIYGDKLPQAIENRLEWELDAISRSDSAFVYWIAKEIADASKKRGYHVGSRGSVASSLVAYLLGITEIDPSEPHYICPGCHYSEFHPEETCGIDMDDKKCPMCGMPLLKSGFKIPAEELMGYEGEKYPDIDLNLCRDLDTIKILEDILGKGRAFRAGTISNIRCNTTNSIVEDCCKKGMISILGNNINICHPGMHFILPEGGSIYDYTPVSYPCDEATGNVLITHYDYHDLLNSLFSIDLFYHDDYKIIYELEKCTGLPSNDIPFNDKKTMELLRDNDMDDIPEFATGYTKDIISIIRPEKFEDLIRINGLSHGSDCWTDNAENLIKEGKEITELISCRDDIMISLSSKGVDKSRAFIISEHVRRGKLSNEDYNEMIDNGISKWYADSCKKIRYLFPRAHAVSYVLSAYRIAYYKAHFPEGFAQVNNNING